LVFGHTYSVHAGGHIYTPHASGRQFLFSCTSTAPKERSQRERESHWQYYTVLAALAVLHTHTHTHTHTQHQQTPHFYFLRCVLCTYLPSTEYIISPSTSKHSGLAPSPPATPRHITFRLKPATLSSHVDSKVTLISKLPSHFQVTLIPRSVHSLPLPRPFAREWQVIASPLLFPFTNHNCLAKDWSLAICHEKALSPSGCLFRLLFCLLCLTYGVLWLSRLELCSAQVRTQYVAPLLPCIPQHMQRTGIRSTQHNNKVLYTAHALCTFHTKFTHPRPPFSIPVPPRHLPHCTFPTRLPGRACFLFFLNATPLSTRSLTHHRWFHLDRALPNHPICGP
jgi:hypothetical protein